MHDDPYLVLLINFKTKFSLIVFLDGFNFYSLVLTFKDIMMKRVSIKFYRKGTHTNTSTPNYNF